MASNAVCDQCGQEPGRWWITDSETGNVSTLGGNCFALVGGGLFLGMETEVVDAVLKDKGYAVTKAERERRKAEQIPDQDPERVIARIAIPADDDDQGDDDQAADLKQAEPAPAEPAEADPADAPPGPDSGATVAPEAATAEPGPDADDPAPY